MAEKTDQSVPSATELTDEELNDAQGGLSLATGSKPEKTANHWRSRGNNVFGFEDLPSN